MIARFFALLVALLAVSLVACSDEAESGPLVGTWKGINPIGGSTNYGENTAVFQATTFTADTRLTNIDKTLVSAVEGSYVIEGTNLVMSATKEYKLTNLEPVSGYWTNYSPPDVMSMPFTLEGSQLTLVTPGGAIVLSKQ